MSRKSVSDFRLLDEVCDLCGTCVAVCPEDCITLLETRLLIDFETCSYCGLCLLVCPLEALEEVHG